MDFFLGRVTRDHEDIDWFAWAVDAPAIIATLADRGYRRDRWPPTGAASGPWQGQRGAGSAWLAVNDAAQVVVAGGRWAGAPWPDHMLDRPPGRLGAVECAIINPAVQIEIKEMMALWVPGRPNAPRTCWTSLFCAKGSLTSTAAQAASPSSWCSGASVATSE